MNITNNILELNYQEWKKTINQLLLYKHFKEQAEKANQDIKLKMSYYNDIYIKTSKEIEEYSQLLDQLFINSTSIYKKIQENINNQTLLEQLYSYKNIDLSKQSYERWLKTGEKIKI